MNPYGVRPLRLDLAAIRSWNLANQRTREEYQRTHCTTGKCNDDVPCHRCRTRAKALLEVATNVEECAELITLIERPSPSAARCGTPSGYKRHRRRGERICDACLTAHNSADQMRRHRKGAS